MALRIYRLMHRLYTHTASVTSLALTVKKAANRTPKTTFFSLPLEIREKIYEGVFDGWWEDYGIFTWDEELGLYCNMFPEAAISKVCRQMYQDVTPFIYKFVHLGTCLDDWDRLFHDIGSINMSYIRHFTLEYNCKWGEHRHECLGLDKYKDGCSRWESIFWHLSRANIRPKSVKIIFDPCQNYPVSEGGTLEESLEYCQCQVYQDWSFLKGIYWTFWSSWRIELRGKYDPLWPLVLHHSLGFTLKRQGDNATLINPDFIRPDDDLKDCTKIRPGVYESHHKPRPQLEW
ncbi:hypothetical protein PC116_g29888 [Phytophthora cactorum]|nr:hypothetical protein PC116_g29888 [Phytophthora cactorum]